MIHRTYGSLKTLLTDNRMFSFHTNDGRYRMLLTRELLLSPQESSDAVVTWPLCNYVLSSDIQITVY
jgi:hypothetical protein